jgi:hypothetical protein
MIITLLPSKGTIVNTLSRIKSNRQQDFSSTLWGRWAKFQWDDAVLSPGGRHVQRLTGLPAQLANLYAELNGLGTER